MPRALPAGRLPQNGETGEEAEGLTGPWVRLGPGDSGCNPRRKWTNKDQVMGREPSGARMGKGGGMTADEKLEQVKRYIEESFAEGKDLQEVLQGMARYVDSLEE